MNGNYTTDAPAGLARHILDWEPRSKLEFFLFVGGCILLSFSVSVMVYWLCYLIAGAVPILL